MHRLLPHTADLAAELDAPNLDSLCGEAVSLVRELLVGESVVEARARRFVPFDGTDDAERFFRFVRELIYLADAEGFLPAGCAVSPAGVELVGERYDPNRHLAERQIKALTRHQYRFERDGGVRAEVVFDL
jgi:SHS2 domain-containing protein